MAIPIGLVYTKWLVAANVELDLFACGTAECLPTIELKIMGNTIAWVSTGCLRA